MQTTQLSWGSDKTTWDTFWTIAKEFEQASQAKFHKGKTEVCLIGNWANKDSSYIPNELKKPKIQVLGAWFGSGSHAEQYRITCTVPYFNACACIVSNGYLGR